MLRTMVDFGAFALIFAVTWLAFRRGREPERPEGSDAFMRNIRSTTGDFGRRPRAKDIDRG